LPSEGASQRSPEAGTDHLLLWLNYSAVALLFGAELNAKLKREAT